MPDPIPFQCAPIASEIEGLEQEKAALQQGLAEASPSLKPLYIREIRTTNLELARKRQELHECLRQHPPAPRPDLVAQTVLLNVNHATRELGVAALIKNVGRGNARGPFRIDLTATLIKGGVATSFVRVFEVPAGITIFSESVLQSARAIQAVAETTMPNQYYVTERMIVPLCYRDENPSCIYEFEFIVDAEQVVAETSEANNRFFARWWTSTPAAVQRDTPFVIEPSESN